LGRSDVEPGFAGTACSGRNETHQSQRQHGLAGAGFADNAEGLARGERERDIVDRSNPARGGGKLYSERANVEARRHENMIAARATDGENLR